VSEYFFYGFPITGWQCQPGEKLSASHSLFFGCFQELMNEDVAKLSASHSLFSGCFQELMNEDVASPAIVWRC